jgi:hypothetical protein
MYAVMPIVTKCLFPDCETLTMGPLCVEHDLPVMRRFVRGRPAPSDAPRALPRIPLYSVDVTPYVREVGTAEPRVAAVRALR